MDSIFRLVLVVILLMMALGWLISEYDQARQELKAGDLAMSKKTADIAALTEALQVTEEERDNYLKQIEDLTADLVTAQSALLDLQQQLAARDALHAEAMGELESEKARLQSRITTLQVEVQSCQQAMQAAMVNEDPVQVSVRPAGAIGPEREATSEVIGLTVAGSLGFLGLSRYVAHRHPRRPRHSKVAVLPIRAPGRSLSLRPQRERLYYRTG